MADNISEHFKNFIAGISESKMECLIGMQFDDFVMVAADQTNAR